MVGYATDDAELQAITIALHFLEITHKWCLNIAGWLVKICHHKADEQCLQNKQLTRWAIPC